MNKIKILLIPLFALLSHATVFSKSVLPEPETVKDYLNSSDLIVVGRFIGVEKYQNFFGYQENAKKREAYENNLLAQGKKLPFSMGIPVIDYKFQVSEIIKPSSKSSSKNISVITYRKPMEGDSVTAASNSKSTTDKYVLFLTENPDGNSYGISTISKEILINENGAVFGFKTPNGYKKFLDGKYEGYDFIELIKNEIQKNLN